MLSAECFVIVLLIIIYLVHVLLKVKAYLRSLGFGGAGTDNETEGSPMRVNNDNFYRRILIGSKIRDIR